MCVRVCVNCTHSLFVVVDAADERARRDARRDAARRLRRRARPDAHRETRRLDAARLQRGACGGGGTGPGVGSGDGSLDANPRDRARESGTGNGSETWGFRGFGGSRRRVRVPWSLESGHRGGFQGRIIGGDGQRGFRIQLGTSRGGGAWESSVSQVRGPRSGPGVQGSRESRSVGSPRFVITTSSVCFAFLSHTREKLSVLNPQHVCVCVFVCVCVCACVRASRLVLLTRVSFPSRLQEVALLRSVVLPSLCCAAAQHANIDELRRLAESVSSASGGSGLRFRWFSPEALRMSQSVRRSVGDTTCIGSFVCGNATQCNSATRCSNNGCINQQDRQIENSSS